MDKPTDPEKLSLQYAAENRKNEIALLWSRSLYFWGFITVLLTAFGTSYGSGHKTLAFIASCFGLLTSLAWSLANRSSKYWQVVWEKKTESVEGAVLSQSIFSRSSNSTEISEEPFWGPKQYSPSKLVIALSDFSVVGWFLLALGTVIVRILEIFPHFQGAGVIGGHIVAAVLTVIGAHSLLVRCRSDDAQPHGASLRAIWFPKKKVSVTQGQASSSN